MRFPCPCSESKSPEETQRRLASREIDRQLRQAKAYRKVEKRALLLGTCGSGKSTFLRSLRLVHGDSFSSDELQMYKLAIYSNVWRGMMKVLLVRRQLGIAWTSGAVEKELVRASVNPNAIEDSQFRRAAPLLLQLWNDPGFHEAFERRQEIDCSELERDVDLVEAFKEVGANLEFFMERLGELTEDPYRPREEHVLHCRLRTVAVHERVLRVDGVPLRIIDIGGHASQRKKWTNVLKIFNGDLHSIIYIIDASAFNETFNQPDGKSMSRMDEAFRCLCHVFDTGPCLLGQGVNLIVFFNKDDLLLERVRKLGPAFAEADAAFRASGLDAADPAQLRKFLFQRAQSTLKGMQHYCHFTDSTDSCNIKKVFNDIRDTVLQNFMREALPL